MADTEDATRQMVEEAEADRQRKLKRAQEEGKRTSPGVENTGSRLANEQALKKSLDSLKSRG